MYVLLSSASQPRYKRDILRCLAAPVGHELRFRYARDLIAGDVRRSAQGVFGKPLGEALICFLDKSAGEQCAVRMCYVLSVNVHGSTVSITLRLGDFAVADPEKLTEELSRAADSSQSLVFRTKMLPSCVRHDHLVETWERTVSVLAEREAFSSEMAFWVVLGAESIGRTTIDTSQAADWPVDIGPDESRQTLIYHYYPKEQKKNTRAHLDITTGGALHAESPSRIEIDSPYDLVPWRFRASSTQWRPTTGSIRIRMNDDWDLDLFARVRGARFRTALAVTVIAAAFALPTVSDLLTGWFPQDSAWANVTQLGGRIMAGAIAAIAIVLGLKPLKG